MKLESKFDIQDRVTIDGDDSVAAIVVAIRWSRDDRPHYEVSWMHEGRAEFVLSRRVETVEMITSRRSFITGLVSLVAAPAIVRAGSIMPVRVMVEPVYGIGPMMHALPIEKMIDMKRVWEMASRDSMAFGSSAVFFGSDGAIRHIPVEEWS